MKDKDFTLYIPIEKINKEKRTVAGWATTEDIDKQSEIVDYTASKEAFSDWAGNIREMHEPKAVGKAVEIIPNDGDKRVWVEAYISKGAEDTWHKINEKILNGFSIGGKTINKTTQIIKDADSPNQSRTVTRITKYKLNELSLVDNPANIGCSFTLVKSIDGVPYQTEIVEDIKKIIITDGEDPLEKEIKLHRDKADSLARKILEKNQLENLSDDNFGLIRKSEKDGTLIKERLIPIPDKVHAVRALEVLDGNTYTLNDAEKFNVHDRAVEKLGTAHNSENCKYCLSRGGTNMGLEKKVDELASKFNELAEVIKANYEGAYKPVPGAKEHPNTKKANDSTPSLGESKPLDGKDPATVNAETQPSEGAYPAKGPIKSEDGDEEFVVKTGIGRALVDIARKAVTREKEAAEKNEGTEDVYKSDEDLQADIDSVYNTAEFIGKMSDEEYDEFVKSLNKEEYADLENVIKVLDLATEDLEKAKDPAASSLRTQEDTAAPVKKDGADSEGSKYPGKHPATVDAKTQPDEGAYPVKGPVKRHDDKDEEEYEDDEEKEEKEGKRYHKTKKSLGGSEDDLAKQVESLSKRLETLMCQPKPRKELIQKINGDANTNDETDMKKIAGDIRKWNDDALASGKPLTTEQERIKKAYLDECLERKFGDKPSQ